MNFTKEINGVTVEYFEDEHIYLADGVRLPAITSLVKASVPTNYDFVKSSTLDAAAKAGTFVHEEIEHFCKTGENRHDLTEVRNFALLQKHYKFEVVANEVPVVLFRDGEAVAAGRLDLVLKMNGELGGADIKRTSTLNKAYVTTQLNLYRLAYEQCYGEKWRFLRALHLKDSTRRFVELPINEQCAWDAVEKYYEERK